MLKKLVFGFSIPFALGIGYFFGMHRNESVLAQTKPMAVVQVFELIRQLRSKKIGDYLFFEGGGKQFLAIVQNVDESPSEDSSFKTSDKLTIYDENGKVWFEAKDFQIGSLGRERLLRSDSHELVFSTNGGGTDWFLNILSFQKGKFVEIGDFVDFQYRGGYFTLPQYRTGNSGPYFKPSQLVVIQQIGGADENPAASVFRTENNKFQKVGEIRMQRLGDFIEKSIAERKK